MKRLDYFTKKTIPSVLHRSTKLLLLLTATIAYILSLFLPSFIQQAHAAGDEGGAIFGPDSGVLCRAVIKADKEWQNNLGAPPHVPNDIFANIIDRSDENAVSTNDDLAYSVDDIKVYLTFEGLNPAWNDFCYSTLVFFQSAGKNKNTFYGVWMDGIANVGFVPRENRNFVRGYVNPTEKTVSFRIDKLGRTFTLAVNGDESIFTRFFPPTSPGAGETGTSPGLCLDSDASDSCFNAYTARFVDAATITFAGDTYRADKWSGDKIEYVLIESSDPGRLAQSCKPKFKLNTNDDGTDINIDNDATTEEIQDFFNKLAIVPPTIQVEFVNNDRLCKKETSHNRDVSTQGIRIFAKYHIPTDTIEIVFKSGGSHEQPFIRSYARVSGTNEFVATEPAFSGCTHENALPRITLGNNVSLNAGLVASATWTVTGKFCTPTASGNIFVLATEEMPPSTPTDTLLEGEDNSCESSSGVLGWILCPVAALLDGVTGWLDERIQNMLVLRDDYLTGQSGQALQRAWSQIRNIAYVILIPIMLVMVIGTALGFEVFSAYTIKKALPRMMIAVIFITLSWYICVFLINVTNVMGGGVRGLITSPFNQLINTSGCSGMPSDLKGALHTAGYTRCGDQGVLDAIGEGVVGIAAGVGTVAAFATGKISIGIIGSALLSAVLILGIIYLLLVVRQMLIIAILLMAPVAILSWIFPGNDKLWKLWWGSFSKLLLVFPLIMLISGVGQVFAWITASVQGETGSFGLASVLIIIFAYISPYLFIPFAFKWAGGVFANIAGMVNDRERGWLDRLKKGRANMRERHSADAKNFGRFKGSNRLTQGLNTLGGALRNRPGSYMSWDAFRQNKKTLGIDRGKLLSTQTAAQLVKAEEDLKADRVFQANKNNDKFLLALANREHAERLMERARNKGNKMEEAAWSQALHAASTVKTANSIGTRLFAIQAHAATGYNLSAGQQGYNELADSVIKTLGINAEHIVRDEATNDIIGVTGPQAGLYTEIMNSSQYALKSAGRYDLGGINNGKGYDPQKGVAKASLYQLSNSKPESIMAMTEQYFDSSTGQLQPNTMDEAGVTYLELQSMLPNATGAAAEEIQKQLQRLNEAGIGSYLSQGSGNMERDPVTGTEKQKEVEDRVYYKGQSDWSEADRIRGWKIIRRAETNADVLAKRARTYQRPDPNTIDSSEA